VEEKLGNGGRFYTREFGRWRMNGVSFALGVSDSVIGG
jgi:hypothetical protein